MKNLLILFVLGLFITQPLLAIPKSDQTKNNQIETVAVESVQSKAQTKKAIRLEKRQARAAKYIAKIERAYNEGRVIGAVLLAIFLGALGIHRVYLGGSPLLILGYLFTFGGLFGILPIIDGIRCIAEGTSHYEKNDRLFAAFENFGNYEQ